MANFLMQSPILFGSSFFFNGNRSGGAAMMRTMTPYSHGDPLTSYHAASILWSLRIWNCSPIRVIIRQI